MVTNLKDQLRRDEGEVLYVYRDSKGILTAGVGHNLEAHGINLAEHTPITAALSDSWLESDIETATRDLLQRLPWTASLDEIRRAALINMTFNMGVGKLLQFKRTLELLQHSDFESAALEMLASAWAKQVGARATRLSAQIKTGAWQ